MITREQAERIAFAFEELIAVFAEIREQPESKVQALRLDTALGELDNLLQEAKVTEGGEER